MSDVHAKTVFVSGCYDVLHAGHVEFFHRARALGDRLVVSVADDEAVRRHKGRLPALPVEHRAALVAALRPVDEVVIGRGPALGLDFEPEFRRLRPDVLVVRDDDRYSPAKGLLCAEMGVGYVVVPWRGVSAEKIHSTTIRHHAALPERLPLRVDFAGGWLDVPSLAVPGGRIVNCAVSPMVGHGEWPYRSPGGGMGGSAAARMLAGCDGVEAELAAGAGWQDPAVIRETGLCVWASGPRPKLLLKTSGDFLRGRMAVIWTLDRNGTTGDLTARPRLYEAIQRAGLAAAKAVWAESLNLLAEAAWQTYGAQIAEGMPSLEPADGHLARKYCGAGHGGYALYLFGRQADREAFVAGREGALAVEPYLTP